MTKQQKILLSLVAIVAALGAGLYFVNTSSTMNSANTDMTSSSNTNTVTGSASVVSSNGAANGDSGSVTITAVPVSTRSDSATVSFQVPENKTNSFTLRITQDGGVITDVSYS